MFIVKFNKFNTFKYLFDMFILKKFFINYLKFKFEKIEISCLEFLHFIQQVSSKLPWQ